MTTQKQGTFKGRAGELVRFFDFSHFHGKVPVAGSTHIRVNQLVKYWPEAEIYKYGEKPDTLIFQKVYVTPDYRFPEHYEGIKILDICDPDWFNGRYHIVETAKLMDAIVCPTETLAKFMGQFHDNVVVIPDRFDLEAIPVPKKHRGKAKTVVWFGYAHNIDTLRPAMNIIDALGLNLLIVADDDPIANRWSKREKKDFYQYIKYDEATIYQDLQTADFAMLPKGNRPEDPFKSNNKDVKANLAGLPVAKSIEDVEQYMIGKNRVDWFKNSYESIRKEYDVKNSVQQYKDLIKKLMV